jgi:hypothetical protein
MAFADPDPTPSAWADPVTHAEAVAAAALSLRPWEATSMFLERAAVPLPLRIRCQRMSKINSGFLEHLRGDFASPRKSNGPLGDDSVLSDDEDAAGGSTPFPGIEGIDEVETGPQHRY